MSKTLQCIRLNGGWGWGGFVLDPLGLQDTPIIHRLRHRGESFGSVTGFGGP